MSCRCRWTRADGSLGPGWFHAHEYGLLRDDGVDLDARCPLCDRPGEGSLRLACAYAGCRMPVDASAGQAADHLFVMIGAPAAGKTHFLATLLHEIIGPPVPGGRGRVAPSERWTAAFADESSRELYRRRLYRPLFTQHKEIPKTSREQPELCLLLQDARGAGKALLPFRDYDGEILLRPDAVEAYPVFRHARGVMLIVDPLAYEPPAAAGGDEALAWETRPQRPADVLLDAYARQLRTLPLQPEERGLGLRPEDKHLAVVVTKADLALPSGHAFMERLPSLTLEDAEWQGRVDERGRSVEAWVSKNLDPGIAHHARQFRSAEFFMVSSFGNRHVPGTAVDEPPHPLGIVEPLQWLLSRVDTRMQPAPVPGREDPDDQF